MRSLRRLEMLARDALADALKDSVFAAEFRRIVYGFAGRESPARATLWQVDRECLVRSGGKIDLLTTSDKHALIVEIKIWDVEKLHQYLTYPRFLREEGLSVCCVGLLGRKGALRGRKLLLEEFLDQAADARFTWGDLLAALAKSLNQNSAFTQIYNPIADIDSTLIKPTTLSREIKDVTVSRDLADIAHAPKKLVKFFLDFVESLGVGFDAEPSQGGNSPIGVAVGKEAWGNWFSDKFTARLKLVFATPRPSDPVIKPHFRFTVILWNKTASGGALDVDRIRNAARHFSSKGYSLVRNVPGKHHRQVPWESPFDLNPPGFLYANAFDTPHFVLNLSDAISLKWENTISCLSAEARRIIADVDLLVAQSA